MYCHNYCTIKLHLQHQIVVPMKHSFTQKDVLRTLLGAIKKPDSRFYLVCWPGEDNRLSIVPTKKILAPSPDDLLPETFCKVKGFEGHVCKIVVLGTEHVMKMKVGIR